MEDVVIGSITIGEGRPLTLFSGPCVIETEELALSSAHFLQTLTNRLGIPLIYKSSYDKANRSSLSSSRGVGLEEGLRILEKVKKEFNIPILTDVHSPEEARAAAEVCDVIQIPAFLCRQTDLLLAAGKTGAVVKVKKGQFLAPWDMKNVVEKILSTGNRRLILTDRGTCFGYNYLVSDMRAIPIMQSLGFPVCFDATHSVQLPGGAGSSSSGQREFIPTLARSAVAAGCNCLFMESHPHPEKALSDKDSVIGFEELPSLLKQLQALHKALQEKDIPCSGPVPS